MQRSEEHLVRLAAQVYELATWLNTNVPKELMRDDVDPAPFVEEWVRNNPSKTANICCSVIGYVFSLEKMGLLKIIEN